jgi:hypothetical protein
MKASKTPESIKINNFFLELIKKDENFFSKIKFSTIFQYRVQLKFLNSIFLLSIFKFQNIKVSLYAAQKAAFYDLFLIMKPYR